MATCFVSARAESDHLSVHLLIAKNSRSVFSLAIDCYDLVRAMIINHENTIT